MKKWTIGNRQRRNVDLALDDTTVSGLHAILTSTDDGRWIVEDCNSTNGTARFDNGQWQRIRRAYVRPDDRLRFGRNETSVRRLLAVPRGGPRPEPAEGVPWTQDLIAGFKAAISLTEAKKSLLFLPNLVGRPSKHILMCAFDHHPVNPFCFMIFFGIVCEVVITRNMTIGNIMDSAAVAAAVKPEVELLNAIPAILVLLPLILIANVSGFCVFRCFAGQRRFFDDFMRMTGVLTGMNLLLLALLMLLVNPVRLSIAQLEAHKNIELEQLGAQIFILDIVGVTAVFYLVVFNIIAYKHFWKISYPKAVFCWFLTGLALLLVFGLMIAPFFVLAAIGS
jgi:hypothetical protein